MGKIRWKILPGNGENRYSDSSQYSAYQGGGRGARLLDQIEDDAARKVRVRYTGEEQRLLQSIGTSISFILIRFPMLIS